MHSWYTEKGPDSDVVMSSRIRLARNLDGFAFRNRLSREEKGKVNQRVKDALSKEKNPDLALSYIGMESLPDIDAGALMEKHLISPEFAREREGKALLISGDETVSIMLMEEDHVRIQVLGAGLSLSVCWEKAGSIDDALDKEVTYAFDRRLGYLTECPTNLGTGLRASLMLYLPALEKAGALGQLANNLSKIGLVIRGTYGERSTSKGSLYQLSNQITLGISEQAAISNLQSIARQIIEEERSCRSLINTAQMEDKIYRAYGILKHARIISFDEFMKLFSFVKLGVATGIINNVDETMLTGLMIDAGQANLQKAKGAPLDAAERDRERAALIRERLGGE